MPKNELWNKSKWNLYIQENGNCYISTEFYNFPVNYSVVLIKELRKIDDNNNNN